MNRKRARSRGVTPVAAALAVFALGVGVSGAWWLQSVGVGRDAEVSSRAAAAVIQDAAKSFRAQHTEGCPTLSSLEEDRFLARNAREDDAWGNRFRVLCEGDELKVTAAGPDGKPNTKDDIRIPR